MSSARRRGRDGGRSRGGKVAEDGQKGAELGGIEPVGRPRTGSTRNFEVRLIGKAVNGCTAEKVQLDHLRMPLRLGR